MTHLVMMSRKNALVQQENLNKIAFTEVARDLTPQNPRHIRRNHVVSLEFRHSIDTKVQTNQN